MLYYEEVNEFPNDILFDHDDVCISIYQPITRNNKQDRLLFKNQIQKVKNELLKDYKETEVEAIMRPLNMIEQDLNFWLKANDGIAILMNRNKCIVYNLFRTIKEYVSVADNFQIKPLLRVYQSSDKYYVLGVNKQTFKLFYGDRYEFRELIFPEGMDITLEEVLGDEKKDTGRGQVRGRQSGTGMYSYGLDDKNQDEEVDLERYFRYIDKYVMDNYSNPAHAPLVLACLDKYYGIFKKVSKNNYLMDKYINKDFITLSTEQIKDESWKIVESVYLNKTQELVDRFYKERDNFNASDDIGEIVHQAMSNRIDTVLIESDRIILGNIDKENESLILDESSQQDILDEIAELVFAQGGEVIMLPTDKMPTKVGAAAIYRY